jgi:FixJ family two-component response regulator
VRREGRSLREEEALRLLVTGFTKKAIAGQLDLSGHTVDIHLTSAPFTGSCTSSFGLRSTTAAKNSKFKD